MKYYKDDDWYAASEDGSGVIYEFFSDDVISCIWADTGENKDLAISGCQEITADEYLTALDKALQNR
jgi:hypothetical protein